MFFYPGNGGQAHALFKSTWEVQTCKDSWPPVHLACLLSASRQNVLRARHSTITTECFKIVEFACKTSAKPAQTRPLSIKSSLIVFTLSNILKTPGMMFIVMVIISWNYDVRLDRTDLLCTSLYFCENCTFSKSFQQKIVSAKQVSAKILSAKILYFQHFFAETIKFQQS